MVSWWIYNEPDLDVPILSQWISTTQQQTGSGSKVQPVEHISLGQIVRLPIIIMLTWPTCPGQSRDKLIWLQLCSTLTLQTLTSYLCVVYPGEHFGVGLIFDKCKDLWSIYKMCPQYTGIKGSPQKIANDDLTNILKKWDRFLPPTIPSC